MTDKNTVCRRFARAAATYTAEAGVQRRIAGELAGLIAGLNIPPAGRILEIGCGTGFLTEKLLEMLKPASMTVNDLCPQMLDRLSCGGVEKMAGDAETLPYPDNLNLIASASTVQWFAELQQWFDKCARALAPDGILAFSTFGPQNMHQTAHLTGSGLEYRTAEELCRMLADKFEVLHVSQQTVTLHFDSARQVLLHLRRTGVTATAKGGAWSPAHLADFERRYAEQFPSPQGIPLTYNPLYITARKK